MYSAAGRAVRLSLDCQRALEANKLNLAVSHLFAPQPAYSAEARRQTEKRSVGGSLQGPTGLLLSSSVSPAL
uniref:Uncharacterized protein n=1 Tax=Onchocerca volvulus TaxID=6282 RepID=A0A2K6W4V6_ONCVO